MKVNRIMKTKIMKTNLTKAGLTFLMMIFAFNKSFAQAEDAMPFSQKFEEQIMLVAILICLLIIFFTVIVMFSQLMGFVSDIREEILKARGLWKEDELAGVDKFWKEVENRLTDAVPIEQEEEIDLGHSYDGIRELDNNLPPWWKWLFYVSIIWAGAYLFHFHVLGNGDLMLDEYENEIAKAELDRAEYLKKAAQSVDETNVTVLASPADLSKGKQIFLTNCMACHGTEGEGGIGPNLTDDHWINGGGIKNVFGVIKYGRPQKGMISWQAQLKPLEMQQVASFILNLPPADPSIAKEPQGELWIEEAQSEEAEPMDSTDTTETETEVEESQEVVEQNEV